MAVQVIDELNTFLIPEPPQIPGLRFRRYTGESDLPRLLATINASKTADREERHDTMESITNYYRHLTNCDPYQDMLIAEVDGEVIAYSRVTWWEEEQSGSRNYVSFGFIHPAFRRKGLGRAMLKQNEQRLREIAADHPAGCEKHLEAFATSYQEGYLALLAQEGYQPVRTFQFMVRPNLSDIPDLPLPDRLEVRPVQPDQYRQVWDASQEAFKDHWGYSVQGEEEYQAFLADPNFNPDLWQVAWDGSEVAGMILNFINQGENEEYGRKRGYTEGISVRKPWRRRGLARALLARSIKMHRDLGMTETALGVDSTNTSGANLLYASMGYQTVYTNWTYRKPLA